MSTTRAWHLLANTHLHGFLHFNFDCEMNQGKPLCDDGITLEEDQFIRVIWSMLGDNTTYEDALTKIAGGI